MNKKLVLLGTALLLCAGPASAQKRVTGRVLDSAGHPVEGASVRVEGGKGIAVTDEKGNFTLKDVPASAKLLKVSYFGMQTATVSVSADVKVVLKENQLGEAVVIGYGTGQKVGTVVGSISTVSSEKIESKPVVNVIDALQGQVAGLNVLSSSGDPGAALSSGGYSASIRGIGSLNASTTPLFVVDGVPTSSSVLGMMNSNDIANVTVLKGASATSIYGSRASNGVIYITTKSGRTNEKAEITLSQSIGWNSLARRIGNPMTADELLGLRREMGIISGEDYMELKQAGVNTDWQKYNYEDAAPMYQTNFSIRGGSQKTSYYSSLSYFKQDGLRPASAFKRITFRTNIDSKPLDWLSYGVKMSVSYDRRRSDSGTANATNYINGGTMSTYMLDPTINPYNEDGSRKTFYSTPFGTFYDPYYQANHSFTKYNDVRSVSSAYININPIKGLNLRSQLSLDAIETRGSGKFLPSHPSAAGYGTASESFSRSIDWTITNTAEYKFNVKDNHHVTLLAGQEGIRGTYDAFSAATDGQSNDAITTLGNGLEISSLPSSSAYEYQYLSFFGRFDYNYAEKYFANFTVRNDQSSRFGRNNKGATFFSGGVMWDVIREDFMAPTRGWLNSLQFRADVGSTGNSAIGNYDHLMLLGNGQYGGNYAYALSQLGTEDLSWEKQIQTSIGFDARILDRITLSFGWYNRVTKDALMDVPLAYTTGFTSVMRNVGELSNSGVELEFGVDVFKNKDWYVNLHGNYSYNKEKVKKLFDGQQKWVYSGTGVVYTVGNPVEYYYPIFAGVDKNTGEQMWYKQGFQGDPVHDFNPETMTKEYDEDALMQNTGKRVNPPHVGGFGITASWKGITLNADFNFVLGKYMFNNDMFFANNPGAYLEFCNQDKSVMNMWRNPGDLTLEPRFGEERQFDTHLLENSSFMRLKNISLSYDLPQSLVDATRLFKNIRITATGRNLFTVTKYTGVDPEVNSNVSNNTFPNTRQYTIGVEVTF